jgi:hypothetical protein
VLSKADLNNPLKITSAPASIRTLITGTFAGQSQGHLYICDLRSVFLMAINMIISVFWKMTPCSLVEMYMTDVSAVPAVSIFKVGE